MKSTCKLGHPVFLNFMNCWLCSAHFQASSVGGRETKTAPGTTQEARGSCVLGELASMRSILVLFVLLALMMCLSVENKQASRRGESSD